MNRTEINWSELTWNPASGCTKVSAECKHCYAETLAEAKRGTPAFPRGFDVVEKPWKLAEPGRIKRPSLIFTNSMTDMFHEAISDAYRHRMFDAIEAAPQHRYQVLTKRPERARDFFRSRKVPASVWLGVTVGVRATVQRLDVLREIDAPLRWVSAEPLLQDLGELDLRGLAWLIAGGESGAHLSDPRRRARRALVTDGDPRVSRWVPHPERIAWVRSLRDQCVRAGVAFWFKQWGGPRPTSGGRELDGRTWDEMPTQLAGAMPAGYAHAERNAYGRRQLELLP